MTRSADSTGHRRNAIHQRQQLRHIMPMRPRHAGGQRYPLRIGDYMMFAARFAPIGRIGTGVCPPNRPHRGTIDYRTRPVDLVGRP